MSVDQIKTIRLAVKVIGVACLKLLFQIKSGLGIIQAGDGQNRLDWTINL